ncbi:hypothetical protein AN389_02655 [Pseudoalteromonas sp. P1-7a]|nr:hypothetical protein AN389_02655 [Pseudoalteromonas sp. P1-7a]
MNEKLDTIASLNMEMIAVLTLLTNNEKYRDLQPKLLDSVLHRMLDNSLSINKEILN